METLKYVFSIGFYFILFFSNAQELVKKQNFEAKLDGMLGVSFNSRTVPVTVGGPNLRFWIKEDFAIGIGPFPSLMFSTNVIDNEGKKIKIFEPKLGLSPRVDFKNFVIIAPVYHFSNPEQWLWTLGGYKFH